MFELGVATFNYLNRFSFEETLDHLSGQGFRCLEITSSPPHMFPRDLDKARRKAMRNEMEKRGFRVASLQPTYLDLNIISLNPAIREESLRQVKENIELAADLGAEMLVLVTGRRHPLLPLPMEKAWNLCIEGIRECNEVARKHGVLIGVENVRNQFVDKGEDVRRILEDLGDENTKAVIDVANANILESPLDALESAKDHLAMVHLSDNNGKTWTHSPIGMGSIDFEAVRRKLEEIGFGGPCVLEVTYGSDPEWAVEVSKERLESLGWRA